MVESDGGLHWWPKVQASGTGLALVSTLGPTLGYEVPYLARALGTVLGVTMIVWPLCAALISHFKKLPWVRVMTALILVTLGLWLDYIYYRDYSQNGGIWHLQIAMGLPSSEPPQEETGTLPPDPVLDSLPAILSRADRFIVVCAIPPKTKTAFDNVPLVKKSVYDWGPEFGFGPEVSDIQNGIRIILDAKTAEAKRYFESIRFKLLIQQADQEHAQ
jgi:hypothetical protein